MITEKELDDKLDYRDIYSKLLKKSKVIGNNITGCCPITPENNPSFGANITTGQCNCFSCGFSGNYVTLYMKLNNISDRKEAIKLICEEHHIITDEPTKKPAVKKGHAPLTLQEYAFSKKLDVNYLSAIWQIEDVIKYNVNAVKIPYYNTDGNILFNKYRFGEKGFIYDAGSKMDFFYGLQFIEYIKESKSVILVEGESDTQTLNFLGFAALGTPGAETIKAKMLEPLMEIEDLKIYIHEEPDNGGKIFLDKAKKALLDAGFKGQFFIIKCSDEGEKDPSDLFIKYGNNTKQKIQNLLDNAQVVNLYEQPTSITGAPVNLRIPAGFIVNNNGIYIENKEGVQVQVTNTPFIISKNSLSLETNQQKVELFIKTAGRTFTESFNRSAIASNTSIINNLSDVGINISSDNVKILMKYKTELEKINVDLIPNTQYVTRFGWIGKDRFMPFCADKIDLDCPDVRLNTACSLKGSLNEWCQVMQSHRQRYIFRFIMASAFAAPLLNLFSVRSFSVYNWATSKSGKTTALKCALSAWGEPDKLKFQFDSTANFIKSRASIMNDMPLAIDEKQQASQSLDIGKFIMDLGNETGRGRCNIAGDGRKVTSWKTIAMMTGEEPLNIVTDGSDNRYIEIKGAPFDNEEQISKVIHAANKNTGHAGKKYMEYIISFYKNIPDAQKAKQLKELTDLIVNIDDFGDINKASMLALIMLADITVSKVIFEQTEEQAKADAIDMISKIIADLKSNQRQSAVMQACMYLYDFYQSNKDVLFDPENRSRALFGFLDKDKNQLCFYKDKFEEILSCSRQKFSPGKTLDFLKKEGYLLLDNKGQLLQKSKYGRNSRMVVIDFYKFEDLMQVKHVEPNTNEYKASFNAYIDKHSEPDC